MVDMTVTTETHIQVRWILRTLDETATWARMAFKHKKSRGVAIRNGKITNNSNILVKTGRSPESNQTKKKGNENCRLGFIIESVDER